MKRVLYVSHAYRHRVHTDGRKQTLKLAETHAACRDRSDVVIRAGCIHTDSGGDDGAQTHAGHVERLSVLPPERWLRPHFCLPRRPRRRGAETPHYKTSFMSASLSPLLRASIASRRRLYNNTSKTLTVRMPHTRWCVCVCVWAWVWLCGCVAVWVRVCVGVGVWVHIQWGSCRAALLLAAPGAHK
jgi:hypothetical protein